MAETNVVANQAALEEQGVEILATHFGAKAEKLEHAERLNARGQIRLVSDVSAFTFARQEVWIPKTRADLVSERENASFLNGFLRLLLIFWVVAWSVIDLTFMLGVCGVALFFFCLWKILPVDSDVGLRCIQFAERLKNNVYYTLECRKIILFVAFSGQLPGVRADDGSAHLSTFFMMLITLAVLFMCFLLYYLVFSMKNSEKKSLQALSDLKTQINFNMTQLNSGIVDMKEKAVSKVSEVAASVTTGLKREYDELKKSCVQPANEAVKQIGKTASTVDSAISLAGWAALMVIMFRKIYSFFESNGQKRESRTFYGKAVDALTLIGAVPLMLFSGLKTFRNIFSILGETGSIMQSVTNGLRVVADFCGFELPSWLEDTADKFSFSEKTLCMECLVAKRKVAATSVHIDEKGYRITVCNFHKMVLRDTDKVIEAETVVQAEKSTCEFNLKNGKKCGRMPEKGERLMYALKTHQLLCKTHFDAVMKNMHACCVCGQIDSHVIWWEKDEQLTAGFYCAFCASKRVGQTEFESFTPLPASIANLTSSSTSSSSSCVTTSVSCATAAGRRIANSMLDSVSGFMTSSTIRCDKCGASALFTDVPPNGKNYCRQCYADEMKMLNDEMQQRKDKDDRKRQCKSHRWCTLPDKDHSQRQLLECQSEELQEQKKHLSQELTKAIAAEKKMYAASCAEQISLIDHQLNDLKVRMQKLPLDKVVDAKENLCPIDEKRAAQMDKELNSEQKTIAQQVVTKIDALINIPSTVVEDQKREQEVAIATNEIIEEAKQAGLAGLSEEISKYSLTRRGKIILSIIVVILVVTIGAYFYSRQKTSEKPADAVAEKKHSSRKKMKKKNSNKGKMKKILHDVAASHPNRIYKGMYNRGFDLKPEEILEYKSKGEWHSVVGAAAERSDILMRAFEQNPNIQVACYGRRDLARPIVNMAEYDYSDDGVEEVDEGDVEIKEKDDFDYDYRTEEDRRLEEQEAVMEDYYAEQDEIRAKRESKQHDEELRVLKENFEKRLKEADERADKVLADTLSRMDLEHKERLKTVEAEYDKLVEERLKKLGKIKDHEIEDLKQSYEKKIEKCKTRAEIDDKRASAIEEKRVEKEMKEKELNGLALLNAKKADENLEQKAEIQKEARKSSKTGQLDQKEDVKQVELATLAQEVLNKSSKIITLKSDAKGQNSLYPCRVSQHYQHPELVKSDNCILDHEHKNDLSIYKIQKMIPCLSFYIYGVCKKTQSEIGCAFCHDLRKDLALAIMKQQDCKFVSNCKMQNCPYRHTFKLPKEPKVEHKKPNDAVNQAKIRGSEKFDNELASTCTARFCTPGDKVYCNVSYLGNHRWGLVKHGLNEVLQDSKLSLAYILFADQRIPIVCDENEKKEVVEAFTALPKVKQTPENRERLRFHIYDLGDDIDAVSVETEIWYEKEDAYEPYIYPLAPTLACCFEHLHEKAWLYAFSDEKQKIPQWSQSENLGIGFTGGTRVHGATSEEGDCSGGIWQVWDGKTRLVGLHVWGSQSTQQNAFIEFTPQVIQKLSLDKSIRKRYCAGTSFGDLQVNDVPLKESKNVTGLLVKS
jgi:hypothetical protein